MGKSSFKQVLDGEEEDNHENTSAPRIAADGEETEVRDLLRDPVEGIRRGQ